MDLINPINDDSKTYLTEKGGRQMCFPIGSEVRAFYKCRYRICHQHKRVLNFPQKIHVLFGYIFFLPSAVA